MSRPPTNAEIAGLFERYAALADLAGDNPFRSRAFRRAAEALRALTEPAVQLAAAGDLTTLPGIGPGTAAAIDTILDTGTFPLLRDIAARVPPTILDLLTIPSVGAKTATRLWRELGITDVPSLETAIDAGRIASLPGLGPATERRIAAGLATLRRRTGRARLGTALPVARQLRNQLALLSPLITRCEISGSVRRWRESVDDIDLVLATDAPGAAVAAALDLASVDMLITDDGDSVRLRTVSGLVAHLHFSPPSHFGTALFRATGADAHLALMPTALPEEVEEVDLYRRLGMDWIPPELREGRDEVEQARTGLLPDLVAPGAVRGDFHSHTTWSDGAEAITGMAEAAAARGYAFLGITDHSHGLGVANGLDEHRLLAQRQEIERVQCQTALRLFAGAEVEVGRDGRLDLDDAVLAGLDVVVASTHTGLTQPRPRLTARQLRVVHHPDVDIIAHPSGRLIEQREPGDFDWSAIFAAAAETQTALKINADPARLDLSADLARQALTAGCLLTVNCDAHHAGGFRTLEYGIGTARRAGATADQIINCWSVERIEQWLQRRQDT